MSRLTADGLSLGHCSIGIWSFPQHSRTSSRIWRADTHRMGRSSPEREAPVEHAVLAIDIGGTKLALGLVDTEGRILQRDEIPTRATEGPERVLARLVELARAMRGRATPSHAIHRVG